MIYLILGGLSKTAIYAIVGASVGVVLIIIIVVVVVVCKNKYSEVSQNPENWVQDFCPFCGKQFKGSKGAYITHRIQCKKENNNILFMNQNK